MALFLLIGLGTGSIYAALALAVVLTYRGTGIVNFAYGCVAMFPAFAFNELRLNGNLVLPWVIIPSEFHIGVVSPPVALVLAVLIGSLLGLILHIAVLQPLRKLPSAGKTVGTVGVLMLLQGLVIIRFGTDVRAVTPVLTQEQVEVLGVRVSADRFYLAGIVVLLTAALALLYKYTRFGLATRAAAESEKGAILRGYSPALLGGVNTVLASTIAGLMGILVLPIVTLDTTRYSLLIVPALAAALLARFSSFVGATAAALLIGVAQSEVSLAQTNLDWLPPSSSQVLPFLVIIVAMVVLGSRLPVRGSLLDARRPAAIRSSRPWIPGGTAVLIAIALVVVLPQGPWRLSLTTSLIAIVIGLSLVVLTGFVGQISLAQMTFAGVGAYTVSRLTQSADWPFLPSILGAIIVAVVVGVVIGLPAVRVRGVHLAVVTMAVAVAFSGAIFSDTRIVGGLAGQAHVSSVSLFGLDLGRVDDTGFTILCLAMVILACAGVTLLRRSRLGLQMLAVRANEQAAAASGIDVARTKLVAFAISSALAGLGGALIGYQFGKITPELFLVFVSLTIFAFTYLAGVGSVAGAVVAGVMASGGLMSTLLIELIDYKTYETMIAGFALIMTVITMPDGLVVGEITNWKRRWGKIRGRLPRARTTSQGAAVAPAVPAADLPADRQAQRRLHSAPTGLEVNGLTVRYGGLVAVDDLSLRAAAGEITGLIGPNGAGKTTTIEALAGFVRYKGSVSLGDQILEGTSAHGRARAGLSRTFQSIELFEDLTVRENLGAAARGGVTGGHEPPAAAQVLGLTGFLDRLPSELSNGQRRLVGVARALVGSPKVLLLDEPAAGLDERESRELGRRLRSLAGLGITVLLIDHDMGLVLSICDSVYVLDFGRLIASGPPAAIRSNPDVLAAYLGSSSHRAGDQAAPDGPTTTSDKHREQPV